MPDLIRRNWCPLPLNCRVKSDMELFKKVVINRYVQGFVKGEKFFSEVLTFIFDLESTSTASQFTFPASQKSKDLNKVSLLLQDLGL